MTSQIMKHNYDVINFRNIRRNRIYQPGKVISYPDVQPEPTTRQTPFSGGEQCAPVRTHRQQVPKASTLAAEHRRPHRKQDECTSSSRRAV